MFKIKNVIGNLPAKNNFGSHPEIPTVVGTEGLKSDEL